MDPIYRKQLQCSNLLQALITQYGGTYSTYYLEFIEDTVIFCYYKNRNTTYATVEKVFMGKIDEISKMSMDQFSMRINKVLQNPVPVKRVIEELREEKLMSTEREEQLATEKGEQVARWLLALNPTMPKDIVFEMAMAAAEMFGYSDMKTGNRFVWGLVNYYDSYKDAQPKKQITEHHDEG